jgi:hypothetical protein
MRRREGIRILLVMQRPGTDSRLDRRDGRARRRTVRSEGRAPLLRPSLSTVGLACTDLMVAN